MTKADHPEEAPAKTTPKHKEAVAERPTTIETPVNDNGLPLVSMILGIVSLVTFMVFLGIPAIVLGIIALKKYPTSNRAFSITGIITGIISTLLMILMTVFILFAVLVGLSEATSEPTPQERDGWQHYRESGDSEQFYEGREGV